MENFRNFFKSSRTTTVTEDPVNAYSGEVDDELILYGGERANGGSGRDTFRVTKNAITRKSNTAVEEQQVVIEDATKKDGDSVILPRIKGGYVGIKQVSYEPETNSNLNGTILLEESGSTVDPVFG